MPGLRAKRLTLLAAAVATMIATAAAAIPLATTRDDFRLPGTQPLAIVDHIPTPDTCETCHSGYGQPKVEPFRAWQGSMMAQAGRDPLMWAALAVSNQDAPASGETCLRCHLAKGWLEGRSLVEDGSAMTAQDREGVQCGVCHRLVDPIAAPENPAPDAAILAALSEPVPAFGGAMMVVDPLDRLRGPFDVVADLGNDPHTPDRSTLLSPFHSSAELCGTCHNLRNPLFRKNDLTGEWELTPLATPNADPTKGFPEQSTYDEWANSEYATSGVFAPEFGGNKSTVSTCQDCHMPDVSGRDANLGIVRDDVPHHTFAGANTFIPAVLPFHPAFGSEVEADVLAEGMEHSTAMLRKAATVEASIASGNLSVRVINESGHKLPTGYPEGRRMWLQVRAFDAKRNVVFESGRYTFATATLESDPFLHVWRAEQGISPALAAVVGLPAGQTFHLTLNNVRLHDNRIPPRGFTNAAFEAIDAEPIGATFADLQHWDEVTYPVGAAAVQAEVTLYYQTASREYVEFLRDENTTTAAGQILYDLWNDHNKSVPVAMARVFVESDTKTVLKCRKTVDKLAKSYRKRHYKEWSSCYEREVSGLNCDSAAIATRLAVEELKVRDRLGGANDLTCAGASLTPASLGHGTVCPVPCQAIVLFDMNDLASCAICQAEALDRDALEAAYGSRPPAVPSTLPAAARSCEKSLDRAASALTSGWTGALAACERDNASGAPPVDCTTDPRGKIQRAKDKAGKLIARCDDLASIPGCATAGDAAAVGACMQAEIGPAAEAYTKVAYP